MREPVRNRRKRIRINRKKVEGYGRVYMKTHDTKSERSLSRAEKRAQRVKKREKRKRRK